MDDRTKYAVGLMTNGHPNAYRQNTIVLRGVAPEDRLEVQRMIMDKRAAWLEYLTLTQRRWQNNLYGNMNNDASAKATREKYVRCQ